MFIAKQIKILGFPDKRNDSILTVLRAIERTKSQNKCIMARSPISFLHSIPI